MSFLDELIQPGASVAFGDGVGTPAILLGELSRAAAKAGDVQLLLGWTLGGLEDLEVGAFRRVRTTMSGFALRKLVDRGDVGYIPARMGTLPALVRDVLRPDVLVASVVPGPDGYRFGSEVGWMRAAVDAGAVVAAMERPALPACDAGPPLPADRVLIVGSSDAPAIEIPPADITDEHRAIGERIARLIPEGSAIQFGPGTIAEAACAALDVPVRVSSGLLSDPVVALDRRNLLIGQPQAGYLAGSAVLYQWADGRPILYSCDITHSPAHLTSLGAPFVAINTALEIDADGQVNVETAGGSTIGGIGGHPDFAYAGAHSPGGLSIIAVTSRSRRGEPTLVDRLAGPVTTPSHDVDVVITEHGTADLRGLSRPERRAALARLWR